MNAYAEKIEIIQWITGLDDKAILSQLRKIKEQSDIKQNDLVDSISLKERESIQRGIEDSANGRVTPHSEVRKKYEKWL
jgi:predicted transcriptional regulator